MPEKDLSEEENESVYHHHRKCDKNYSKEQKQKLV